MARMGGDGLRARPRMRRSSFVIAVALARVPARAKKSNQPHDGDATR